MAVLLPDGSEESGQPVPHKYHGHMSSQLPEILTQSPSPSSLGLHAFSKTDGTASPLYSGSQALVGASYLWNLVFDESRFLPQPPGTVVLISDKGRGGPRGLASGGPVRPPTSCVTLNNPLHFLSLRFHICKMG